MEELIIREGVLEHCLSRNSTVIVNDGVHTIGEGAFKGCTSVETVLLPDTVTDILDDAFKGCRKLERICLPPALKRVGNYAFHRCHMLRQISLPAGVTELGNCVFLYCDSLIEVRMPGVTMLGKQVFLNDVNLQRLQISEALSLSCICDVFTGCGKLEEVVLTGSPKLLPDSPASGFADPPSCTTYSLKDAVSIISSENQVPPLIQAIAVDIYRMMEIRDQVVYQFLTNIRHVELPEGITGIGKSCFFDKKGILSVKLPSSLRFIDSRAFRNCINLERVELGSEELTISPDAFKNCTTLKYIRLPGEREFTLKGLEHIGDDVPSVVSAIHSQVLGNFSISGTTLLKYRGSEARVVVPDGIQVIGERAFAGNEAIDRVVLPASVLSIEESAFENCLVLQTIELPDSLQHLGKSAFEHCLKLIRMVLPKRLQRIEARAFNRCKTLREVELGHEIKEIGSQAFYGCTSLRSMELPEGITHLGELAFYKCTSLKQMILPSSLLSLGSLAFSMSGVTEVILRQVPKDCGSDLFSQCARLKRLILDDGVRRIGDKMAFQCQRLAQVILPDSLEEVGRNAFEGSPWLLHLPEDGTAGSVLLDGSRYKGDAVIPSHVKLIAGGAFYGNEMITSVKVPETAAWMGPRAFCDCTNLQQITLPDSIPLIREGTFSYCPSLLQIITDGLWTQVEAGAFYDCISLTGIPSLRQATEIGKEAFFGCVSLREVHLSCPALGDRAFERTAYLKELTAHAPLAAAGSVVISGAGCEGQIVIPEGTVRIGDYAFCGNQAITRVVFPVSFRHLGAHAFSGCTGLTEVSFSAPLETLGNGAFEASGLSGTVVCPVKVIEHHAFSRCSAMTRGVFPLAEIMECHAFEGCTTLQTVECAAVTEVGDQAFDGCKALLTWDARHVRILGERAFYGCCSLKYVALYGGTVVKSHCFEDCCDLKELVLTEDRKAMPLFETYSMSGCTALKRIIWNETVYDLHSFDDLYDPALPPPIRQIMGSVYSCFSIDEERCLTAYENLGSSVAIPCGIKRIDREVFKDRAGLEEVTIPDSVDEIGPRAFHGTGWLERLSRQGMVIVNHILLNASFCTGEVVIPPHVRKISGWAFANCFGLTGVTLVQDRIIIEEHAFRNCINLHRLTLADGTEYRLEHLEDREKELPSMVKQIWTDCYHCFKTENGGHLVECTGNIVHLKLPAGITCLGNDVFKESNLLSTVALARETEEIETGAFRQCKWLTLVEHATYIRAIGAMAFSGCIRLERIDLGPRLLSIGVKAFESCTALIEITIPEGVTELPDQVFFRCHELRRITLPSTLRRIGKEAFAFCYHLKELSLPHGLTSIDSRAFAWCRELTLVPDELPSTVTWAADAFHYTPSDRLGKESDR